MKLFEYEAKNILRHFGIAIPAGRTADNPEKAADIAAEIGKPVFLKSQVTVSGRGKAGGIIPARNADEAGIVASRLIGSRIQGLTVRSLLVEEELEVEKQFYAAVAIDRQARAFVALASARGGVDIEETARSFPQDISRRRIDPLSGFTETDADRIMKGLGLVERSEDGSVREGYYHQNDFADLTSVLTKLYQIALENDAELVEINPLVKTPAGDFIAADARITIDDNALFRHPEYNDCGRYGEEDTPGESAARKQRLSYVDMDGEIGIIGNGAGLVMATLDMVHLLGGKPANFLDTGGGIGADAIKNGVLLVMARPEVRAVLINILGGITRCDLVAQGVVEGLKEAQVKMPVAVRMMGTREEEGREILRQNGIEFFPDMETAARAAVEMGKRS